MTQQDREYLARFGGYAYPMSLAGCTDGGVYNILEQSQGEGCGATLLDWFARDAMHAELVTAGAFEGPRDALVAAAQAAEQTVLGRIAFNAYDLAEAMLTERKRRGIG